MIGPWAATAQSGAGGGDKLLQPRSHLLPSRRRALVADPLLTHPLPPPPLPAFPTHSRPTSYDSIPMPPRPRRSVPTRACKADRIATNAKKAKVHQDITKGCLHSRRKGYIPPLLSPLAGAKPLLCGLLSLDVRVGGGGWGDDGLAPRADVVGAVQCARRGAAQLLLKSPPGATETHEIFFEQVAKVHEYAGYDQTKQHTYKRPRNILRDIYIYIYIWRER